MTLAGACNQVVDHFGRAFGALQARVNGDLASGVVLLDCVRGRESVSAQTRAAVEKSVLSIATPGSDAHEAKKLWRGG